ncbi:Ribonuclease BN [Oceanicola granulosus HTCC2516]|uniref:Ribonuclease BN n=1 Tax=Oceanicola granulosus (strain ATCC BAA-861 / DSM 15982 / KCTC 12143 / HTCC2516) TaxID=314256 RepID=Q2CAI2_OCEGH|nr:Ribonuclease BN [Oceanicola granulosus HTCC2516]
MAFYGLLALFPAITAMIAIAGLVMEPAQITEQLQALGGMLPQDAADILIGQAQEVAGSREGGLGLAAVLGILLALYSASKGVSSLMEGINVAYDEEDQRGFIKRTALTLALTLVLIVGIVLGLASTVVLPAVLNVVDLGPVTEILIAAFRWALLLVLAVGGFALLYRFAPDRSSARMKWLTPGAIVGCILWIVATVGFAIYADNFGSYNESFGALGGVIVLLMWLWLSSYAVLMGAEINSEIELQTRVDTTTGPPMPRGTRGAVKADNLPEPPEETDEK